MSKLEFLDPFIIQSGFEEKEFGPGGQVIKTYPKEYMDLKMRVSFGKGGPARVTWISFLAPEMQTMEGFYPVYLFYKKAKKLILAYGLSETKEAKTSWPNEILNNEKKISDYLEDPPRYGDSFIFKTYSPSIKDNKVSYVDDNNKPISNETLNNDLTEIINYYKKTVSLEITKEDSPIGQGIFYMEKQLEDFIVDNWNETDLGKKYDLIDQQYRTDVGIIDILATDKKTKSHVVIELKKNQTNDEVLGQIKKYMGWIKVHKKDDNVIGIVVAKKFDKKFYYAMQMEKDVYPLEYEVNFKLKEFKK
jgi:hypothetical protein|tara:strand:- start:93 stop:1007 length:915 start_codon:yes stop_codon:yes gene_type:complete